MVGTCPSEGGQLVLHKTVPLSDCPLTPLFRDGVLNTDLICPLTYQLLRNFSGDSRPDLSFDKSASLKHLFSLARASLVAVSKLYLSFGCSGGDYTSSCPPSLVSARLAFMGIHDFLYLLEWTNTEVQEEPYLDVRPTLQRLPFYCTPPATADVVIPNPTTEDLAAGTPSSKILAVRMKLSKSYDEQIDFLFADASRLEDN
ncbi:hypothetical protein Tco_0878555 [Tanacetum coccineum]|uniref:Uncharacterized protein n=1 Tax=Tanacetum coccineum TaxID=301880 RepID=A0ABQ5C035_9ASTR